MRIVHRQLIRNTDIQKFYEDVCSAIDSMQSRNLIVDPISVSEVHAVDETGKFTIFTTALLIGRKKND